MKINRTCKICGKPFVAIKTTQFFHNRKCFKKDYYERTKAHIKEIEKSYPYKKCGYCEETAQLDFDPIKNEQKFNAWACPHCGATNRLIWEYQSSPNSKQIISNFLVSIQSQLNLNTFSQMQMYHLPIMHPEQGNPSVVVMTCETLNISDIQRKNRKKIVFS